MIGKTELPEGYTVNEGGNETGGGWFYIPCDVDQVFYPSRVECVRAVWASVLGDNFAASIRALLEPEGEFEEMKRLNGTPEYATDICATQNYLDANMVMFAAFEEVLGRGPNMEDESVIELWNAAWESARYRYLGKPYTT